MRILLVSFLLAFLSVLPAGAASPPLCEADTRPVPAAPGLPARVSSWTQEDAKSGKISPSCMKWGARDHKLSVALAGSFHATGEKEVLARFGAISHLGGLQYWSWSEKKRETLVKQASALDAKTRQPRTDFLPDEMKSGAVLYFQQSDNRSSGPVQYRMTVEQATPEKIVIRIENVSRVKFMMMTVYKPGDIQSVYVLEQGAGGVWSYFNLLGIDTNVTLIGGNPALSATSRAQAMFGHYTMEQKAASVR